MWGTWVDIDFWCIEHHLLSLSLNYHISVKNYIFKHGVCSSFKLNLLWIQQSENSVVPEKIFLSIQANLENLCLWSLYVLCLKASKEGPQLKGERPGKMSGHLCTACRREVNGKTPDPPAFTVHSLNNNTFLIKQLIKSNWFKKYIKIDLNQWALWTA